MPFITRPQLANRHNVTPRTVARRQEDDPNYPKSRIIRGYHYFDLDEVEAYERALAGAPRIPKAPPIARPSSNHTDATARSTAVDDVADRRVGRRRLLAVAGRGPLPAVTDLMRSWGFKYSGVGLTWLKLRRRWQLNLFGSVETRPAWPATAAISWRQTNPRGAFLLHAGLNQHLAHGDDTRRPLWVSALAVVYRVSRAGIIDRPN